VTDGCEIRFYHGKDGWQCECGSGWKQLCVACFDEIVFERQKYSSTSICCDHCFKTKLAQDSGELDDFLYPYNNTSGNLTTKFFS